LLMPFPARLALKPLRNTALLLLTLPLGKLSLRKAG
jgi:hypothetical protein